MTEKDIYGRIHSFQSLGTVDGPGVRFVVFLQGCPLRCGCCHNPDTWELKTGEKYTCTEVVEKAKHFRDYFGKDGGITLSGGEPLLQANFVKQVFSLCHKEGINTCLDTSGCILDSQVREMLEFTDRVLLDIKYTDEKMYQKYVGCSLSKVLEFLEYVNHKAIPTTIRQVIIPSLNDCTENILKLKSLVSYYSCVDKVELLPFKKICKVKYDSMNIRFPFENIPEPSKEKMQELNELLKDSHN